MNEFKIMGIPISKGIAIGKVKRIDFVKNSIHKGNAHSFDYEKEKEIVTTALNELIEDSKRIVLKYQHKEKIKSIIESEIMFLEDPELLKRLTELINKEHSSLEAINKFFDDYIKIFHLNDNSISKIKVNDISFLRFKIIQKLNNVSTDYSGVKGKIILTSILNSDEILKIYEHGAIGFVTEYGSNLSHSSIISRSLSIPAVFGIGSQINQINDEDSLIIDGNMGEVWVNPNKTIVKDYGHKKKNIELEIESYKNIKEVQLRNKSGKKINFYTNINNLMDLENTLQNNADGIGLVRTENLVSDLEEIFDEDFQYELYNKIAESIYPKPATFRLFDFGYDKLNLNDEKEDNPALGLRGIRYLLNNKHIMVIQIRALIRSSENGNLKILIPMVTSLEEVNETREIIKTIADELEIFCPKIGVMIETPVAAYMTKEICEISDYISVGTNDLMQYFFAADRNNDLVSSYLDYSNKSFLKLLNSIKKECDKKEKELVICGQIASDEISLEYLVNKEFTNFSVVPARILLLKKLFTDN